MTVTQTREPIKLPHKRLAQTLPSALGTGNAPAAHRKRSPGCGSAVMCEKETRSEKQKSQAIVSQAPLWQRIEQVCKPQSSFFPQVSPQVGTSTVQGNTLSEQTQHWMKHTGARHDIRINDFNAERFDRSTDPTRLYGN
ncbi:hypothetical protein ROHU_031901 [Labeo rohita]|uniref:Uncharacterized protein n=1 Tax=Labeo rohita TaxID=84645 RepID=A0A498LJE2_LABRO|nr:hypothetical protein ROHU_031901 [Labeo rohita]